MKFELLPNEILIEAFEYLNAFDIFYAFDQLNYRLYQLIRNIPLHLTCQHVSKSIFDQFCTKMAFNSQIMHQIYSIQLSNKDTCYQIDKFLSIFSLDQFSNLRSLTFIEAEEDNIKKLQSISQLHSLHLISPKIKENSILPILPKSTVRIFSIPTLPPFLTYITQPTIITHLTISGCSLDTLCQLFDYVLNLNYLNIHILCKTYSLVKIHTYITNHDAIHLKHFIIGDFKYSFETFEILVKYTPNLKSLSICSFYQTDMIDADRWESLITSSLPSLQIFKFIFGYYREKDNYTFFDKFQTDFWHKQHHWYTEYSSNFCFEFIYTIPYLSNIFSLKLHTNRYSQKSNVFDNVTNLTLSHKAILNKCGYYFANITSLKLITASQDYQPVLKIENIQIIKTVVKLFYLKHLDISVYDSLSTPSVLLEIIRKAPQLSSLAINPRGLVSLFNDNKLCKYLSGMIKKIDICKFNEISFKNTDEIEQFCRIFSNIEQLKCNINQSNDILFLLNHLSKLSILKIYLSLSDNEQSFYTWLKEESHKLNFMFHVNSDDKKETEVNIWFG